MAQSSASGPSVSSASAKLTEQSSRYRRSLVWDYFYYDTDRNKSVCQIDVSGSVCGKHISGKNPTNLKHHMKAAHPSILNEFLIREESIKKHKVQAKKRETSLIHQSTLKESLSKQTMYTKDSHQYKAITRKLAIFVGSSNVANRIVENFEFVNLLQTMDPRYPVPGRTALCKELTCVLIELKAKITAHLESASKVSICCDVWSKIGLTSSYLGVTGHFFSWKDRSRHTVTLAVRRMIGSHTAVNIRALLDKILSEWGLDYSKISATITDNCSNMVAAFKENLEEDDDTDVGGDESDNDADDDEMYIEEIPSNEENDFLDCEESHDEEFICYNRISCFSHTLQLVVNKFSDCDSFKQLMKHAHVLVRKFNSSTKATEQLISLSGKKLTKDCPIRWSSTFLMVNRMLEVRNHLKVVLEEQGWDDLAASEWRMLQNVVNLLQPFAKFTSLLSGDEFTTLSCVVPAIMDLNIHLEEVKTIGGDISKVAEVLQTELQRCFKKYTAPGIIGHHALMLAATFLDVRYRLLLNSVQCDSAKQLLADLLKNGSESSQSSSQCASPSTDHEEDGQPPGEKRFKHLGKVLELRIKEGIQKASTLPPGKSEIEHYFSSVATLSEKEDPITFWLNNESTYPLLSSLAVDLLCIPASSAPVERTFSTAGESTCGRRNRLSDQNLEREILIRRN